MNCNDHIIENRFLYMKRVNKKFRYSKNSVNYFYPIILVFVVLVMLLLALKMPDLAMDTRSRAQVYPNPSPTPIIILPSPLPSPWNQVYLLQKDTYGRAIDPTPTSPMTCTDVCKVQGRWWDESMTQSITGSCVDVGTDSSGTNNKMMSYSTDLINGERCLEYSNHTCSSAPRKTSVTKLRCLSQVPEWINCRCNFRVQ